MHTICWELTYPFFRLSNQSLLHEKKSILKFGITTLCTLKLKNIAIITKNKTKNKNFAFFIYMYSNDVIVITNACWRMLFYNFAQKALLT